MIAQTRTHAKQTDITNTKTKTYIISHTETFDNPTARSVQIHRRKRNVLEVKCGNLRGPIFLHFGFLCGPIFLHFGFLCGPIFLHFGFLNATYSDLLRVLMPKFKKCEIPGVLHIVDTFCTLFVHFLHTLCTLFIHLCTLCKTYFSGKRPNPKCTKNAWALRGPPCRGFGRKGFPREGGRNKKYIVYSHGQNIYIYEYKKCIQVCAESWTRQFEHQPDVNSQDTNKYFH